MKEEDTYVGLRTSRIKNLSPNTRLGKKPSTLLNSKEKNMTKTAREIELEKKLSIAVKALKYYANSNCWNDCLYNGRIKVSAYLQTAGYKTAQQALKEIEKCVKNMD